MIQINDENIIVGEIKEFLHSFNLPQCKIYKKEKPIVPNSYYIKDDYLYKSDNKSNLFPLTVNNRSPLKYHLNSNYLNITKNLELRTNLYDTYTHRYLGEYLRFIRDYKNVDLMCMYNCFDGEMPKDNSIDINISDTLHHIDFNNHKVYMVPVKNHAYTISFVSHKPVEVFCAYYINNVVTNDPNKNLNRTYQKISINTFGTSILYDKLEDSNYNEKDFYMFLVFDAQFTGPVVILEGDYTDSFNKYINSKGYMQMKETINQEKLTPSYKISLRPQLLEASLKNSFAISDKLVEYIVNNVICPLDDIKTNIKHLQSKLISVGFSKDHPYLDIQNLGVYGEWNKNIEEAIIKIIHSKLQPTDKGFDCLGYFDSTVEHIISLDDMESLEG